MVCEPVALLERSHNGVPAFHRRHRRRRAELSIPLIWSRCAAPTSRAGPFLFQRGPQSRVRSLHQPPLKPRTRFVPSSSTRVQEYVDASTIFLPAYESRVQPCPTKEAIMNRHERRKAKSRERWLSFSEIDSKFDIQVADALLEQNDLRLRGDRPPEDRRRSRWYLLAPIATMLIIAA